MKQRLFACFVESEFQSFQCLNAQICLSKRNFCEAAGITSPLIWFWNHNDVISIKIQSHVSRINCDSDVPTCGQNLVRGVRKVFFMLVKLYRVLKVKCRA